MNNLFFCMWEQDETGNAIIQSVKLNSQRKLMRHSGCFWKFDPRKKEPSTTNLIVLLIFLAKVDKHVGLGLFLLSVFVFLFLWIRGNEEDGISLFCSYILVIHSETKWKIRLFYDEKHWGCKVEAFCLVICTFFFFFKNKGESSCSNNENQIKSWKQDKKATLVIRLKYVSSPLSNKANAEGLACTSPALGSVLAHTYVWEDLVFELVFGRYPDQ